MGPSLAPQPSPAATATASALLPVGHWRPGPVAPVFEPSQLSSFLARVREPIHVVKDGERARLGLAVGGMSVSAPDAGDLPLMATLPPLFPEWLGDRSFCEAHGVRFPYIAGEMANGITTTKMVIAMAQAGMMGFFGAGGLAFPKVEQAVDELGAALGDRLPWGVNLIHSPNEPTLESRVAELIIRRGVRIVSASAFMELTPAVVRCAAAGLRTDGSGRILRARQVFAKLSRAEVARRFMSPAPQALLQDLVEQGLLTSAEAALAARIPIAEDVTVEADSGGHTDNQSLVALFPAILALRNELMARHAYDRPIRVGAAGGLGTPSAVAAAFSLGAAYVVTGSINQAAVESGLSEAGKIMLAQADVPDVVMAPAADMFELGVKVQVLKRGTLFAQRAAKLYDVYQRHSALEHIPPELRASLEREVLHASLDEIWAETRAFWLKRDPAELSRAEADPRHRMVLVFRWYLGKASKWAIDGEASRRADFQIWSGPAMGSFNRWAQGSFLEDPKNRTVVQLALNLLEGAAAVTRAQQLRASGLPLSPAVFEFRPRPLI